MAKLVMAEGVSLLGGLVNISAADLALLQPESETSRGVVLANERTKVNIMLGEGDAKRPVEFVASVYIQRAPLTDDEKAAIDAVAAAGAKKKADIAQQAIDAQRDHSKALEIARKMGQEEAYTGIERAGRVLPVLQNIAAAVNVTK